MKKKRKMKMKMKKREPDLYQGSIEGMKDLKLPSEIESKDEKFQMYLGDKLNKIENNFPDAYDKYQRFIANEEKNIINYEMHSSKVAEINFLRQIWYFV